MNKQIASILIGALTLITGCIPSVHPLYREQDLIFDLLLVGEWVEKTEKSSKETWTFSKREENAYTLLHVDDEGRKGELITHLLKVNDGRFLDFYPADSDLKLNGFYAFHVMAVHTFMRMRLQGDSLEMSYLDPDWIKAYLAEHPDEIKHEKVEDGILLTAQPKELQAFMIKHSETPDAWKTMQLVRRTGGEKVAQPPSAAP
jgi:hypothetical protein